MLIPSVAALLAAIALAGVSRFDRAGTRRAGLLGVSAVSLAVMWAMPLDLDVPHGDLHNYIDQRPDREGWEQLVAGVDGLRFDIYLGGRVAAFVDYSLLGHSDTSPLETFAWLTRGAAMLFVGGLIALAGLDRWSRRSTAYAALAIAAPPVALLYGYLEFGHLPLAIVAWAIPLALVGLERGDDRLVALATLSLGVAGAVHGSAIVALVFVVVALIVGCAVGQERWINTSWRALVVTAFGLVGWLAWVPFLVIADGSSIGVGNAHETFPLRSLIDRGYHEPFSRMNVPLFSLDGATEIGFELLITGALGVLLLIGSRETLRVAVGIGALAILPWLVFVWPMQGLGNDTDFLSFLFPAYFGIAWLIARSPRRVLLALPLLALGHVALAHVATAAHVIEPIGPP